MTKEELNQTIRNELLRITDGINLREDIIYEWCPGYDDPDTDFNDMDQVPNIFDWIVEQVTNKVWDKHGKSLV